jgi:predicted DNA binding CopG/RHH family protein
MTYIYLISAIACLTTGYYIKSNFFRKIQTPSSPTPTFHFSQEQINEIQELLDKGETLDQDTKDKLDQDFRIMLGEEEYEKLMKETLELQNEFNLKVEELLNEEFFSNLSNLGIDYTSILEIIDTIINFINQFL